MPKKKNKITPSPQVPSQPENSNENTIWSNPMVSAAKKALSPEDLERWKDMGEAMFNGINFENNKVELMPAEEEAKLYVEEQLKSGLHPSMMEDNEKALMEHIHGETWYEKWGYVAGDLNDIVTLKKE